MEFSTNCKVPFSQISPEDIFLSNQFGPQSSSTTSRAAIGGQASNGIQPMSKPPWFWLVSRCTSTQRVKSLPYTSNDFPVQVPPAKPVTLRVGMPATLSITEKTVVNSSQLPSLVVFRIQCAISLSASRPSVLPEPS